MTLWKEKETDKIKRNIGLNQEGLINETYLTDTILIISDVSADWQL